MRRCRSAAGPEEGPGEERIERVCRNCEYFDAHHGDCLSNSSPRFQTQPDWTCWAFFPDSIKFPK